MREITRNEETAIISSLMMMTRNLQVRWKKGRQNLKIGSNRPQSTFTREMTLDGRKFRLYFYPDVGPVLRIKAPGVDISIKREALDGLKRAIMGAEKVRNSQKIEATVKNLVDPDGRRLRRMNLG
jgi:hypothetical protein